MVCGKLYQNKRHHEKITRWPFDFNLIMLSRVAYIPPTSLYHQLYDMMFCLIYALHLIELFTLVIICCYFCVGGIIYMVINK